MALQGLDDLRQNQALSLAYFDSFLAFAVIGLCLAGSVFFMDRAVVQKGAHIAAE
jgi:DHA2 family multidrug resistance protein